MGTLCRGIGSGDECRGQLLGGLNDAHEGRSAGSRGDEAVVPPSFSSLAVAAREKLRSDRCCLHFGHEQANGTGSCMLLSVVGREYVVVFNVTRGGACSGGTGAS